MKYTFYIFQASVTNFTDALQPQKLSGPDAYSPIKLKGISFAATAYVQRNKVSEPSWLEYVLPHADIKDPDSLLNQTNSLIVLIRTKSGRICAMTAGQGHTALDRKAVEKDFGLEVALRILTPSQIKGLDSNLIGGAGMQKRHRAGRSSDLREFPVNFYRDKVTRLDGNPEGGGQLGKRFSGATSCGVTGQIPFANLGEFCELLLTHRGGVAKPRLSATRPWIEVDNPKVITALDSKLQKALISRGGQDIGVALPDISQHDAVTTWTIRYRDTAVAALDDLDPSEIAAALTTANIRKPNFRDIQILGADSDGSELVDRQLYEIITLDADYRGKPYALNRGRWLLLDYDHVKEIDRRLGTFLPSLRGSAFLPDMASSDKREGDYNKRVAATTPAKFVCLDGNEIPVDGIGVEPCDLVSKDGAFIHVKKWASSQDMSALVKQGENAMTLLFESSSFREALLLKLPSAWRAAKPWKMMVADFQPQHFKLVYAIADAPVRAVPMCLPCFTRLSIVEAAERMRGRGVAVHVGHIAYKKPKKGKKK